MRFVFEIWGHLLTFTGKYYFSNCIFCPQAHHSVAVVCIIIAIVTDPVSTLPVWSFTPELFENIAPEFVRLHDCLALKIVTSFQLLDESPSDTE